MMSDLLGSAAQNCDGTVQQSAVAGFAADLSGIHGPQKPGMPR